MIFQSGLADNVMKEKINKYRHPNSASNANNPQADQLMQKRVYSSPKFKSYGPLSKNIATGVLSGAEADSSFSV